MTRVLRLVFLLTLPVLVGCATNATTATTEDGEAGAETGAEVGGEADSSFDPFEPANRLVFAFNDGIDRILLAPVAKGYDALTPAFVQQGVDNFFANLYDFNGAINAGLQGRFAHMAENTGRFVVNSSVGIFGLLDPASGMGMESHVTDFGHTLATWGVGQGPYLVMPFIGPRTLRSGMGEFVDSVSSPRWQLDAPSRISLLTLEIVDTRASLAKADDLVTGDRYIFLRDAYLQHRRNLVSDGEDADSSFSDFEDDLDWPD